MDGALGNSIHGVLVWNTFARTGNPGKWLLAAQQRHADRYGTRSGAASLCINPPTFDADRPDAPAASNPGSLPGGLLHFNDFDLFYASIRANAVARSDAFLATRPRPF